MSADQLRAALADSTTADACVALASQAEQLADSGLQRECFEQAIALDRNSQAALLGLAALSLEETDHFSAAVLLEESARITPLPEAVEALRLELSAQLEQNADSEYYFRAIGRIAARKPDKVLSIVLITNLFPPQEFGGYGRMMWEFARGLIERGHAVRVLTADEDQFAKAGTTEEIALEAEVLRTLNLAGSWVGGRGSVLTDRTEVMRRLRDNAARVRTAINKMNADLVIAGNLDLLGLSILRPALDQGIPVLHTLANATPGYATSEQPAEPHYWVAPCSDWNGEVFKQSGFSASRVETLYPGARVDRFFRFFLPDIRRLRICYASLVLPYKGADTLVDALGRLHDAGVDFSAEIAGDTPDAAFLEELKSKVTERGMAEKVQFTGFLDRDGLSALFARNNVLVFPSRFDEPFGISQVEALAAGLVVVSSGTGGAKEIVRPGQDGLLFDAGSAEDLASKLEQLSRDPELFARLQRQGQARASVFSVEQAVQKIETLAHEMQASIDAAETESIAAIA